jgi:microbial collagenase
MLLFSCPLRVVSLVFLSAVIVGCSHNKSNETKSPSNKTYQNNVISQSANDNEFIEPPVSSRGPALDILPNEHDCNGSIRLYVSKLSDDQLHSVCADLDDTRLIFHDTLGTNYEPVKGDQNEKVNIYIYDGYKHYIDSVEKISGLSTNPKGGFFYEGNPFDAKHQPSIYLFVSSASGFSVWNLKHEFSHYLNARFVKYGHVNDSALYLFWEEGLAEYIAKGADNPQAISLLKSPKLRTLADIFDVTYKDTSEEVYLWSYLGIRYIVENHPTSLVDIVSALRLDSHERFKETLETLASSQEEHFQNWLKELSEN